MATDKLTTTARRVIGISRLRKEVPTITSRTKDDFINYLYENNLSRLQFLIAYYTQLKKRNVFFAYSQIPLNFGVLTGKWVRHKETDLIFEFNDVKIDDHLAIVDVNAHSEIFEFNVEEPEKLTPLNVRFRKKFSIFFNYHINDSIIEVKTRSPKKFEVLKSLLEEAFSLPEGSIVLIKITQSEYKKIDALTRYKSMTASGINIAGANKISIEGDDVEQTRRLF